MPRNPPTPHEREKPGGGGIWLPISEASDEWLFLIYMQCQHLVASSWKWSLLINTETKDIVLPLAIFLGNDQVQRPEI